VVATLSADRKIATPKVWLWHLADIDGRRPRVSFSTLKRTVCTGFAKALPEAFGYAKIGGGGSHQRTRLSTPFPCYAGKYSEIYRTLDSETAIAPLSYWAIQLLTIGIP
jgi:hypothetical protein